MIDLERLAAVRRVGLEPGLHANPDFGMCAMEAAAWISHSGWSDKPDCVSPVIGAMVRHWNDTLQKEDRDRLLLPLVPLLVGTTRHQSIERRRAIEALDWRVRTNLPVWLRLAGWWDSASAVAALPHAKRCKWHEWAPTLTQIWDASIAYRSASEQMIRSAAPGYERDSAVWYARRALELSGGKSSGAATAHAAGPNTKTNTLVVAMVSTTRDIARHIAESVTMRAAEAAAATCEHPDLIWRTKSSARRDVLNETVDALQQSAVGLIRAMVEITETRH